MWFFIMFCISVLLIFVGFLFRCSFSLMLCLCIWKGVLIVNLIRLICFGLLLRCLVSIVLFSCIVREFGCKLMCLIKVSCFFFLNRIWSFFVMIDSLVVVKFVVSIVVVLVLVRCCLISLVSKFFIWFVGSC